MSQSSDKLYVYLNHKKVVDHTVALFFEEQGGGRTFSEFTKSIIYHHALQCGYQTQLADVTSPPAPSPLKVEKNLAAKASNKTAKKKHKHDHKGKSDKGKSQTFIEGNADDEEVSAPIPSDDSMSDDILLAVNSIM
jgi:hypothetical protein